MKLSQIHDCRDDSDVTPLYLPINLFLKPMSKINITIHFPQLKQSIPTGGTTVSSWGIMEKLKALVSPDQFISIKTVKNTLEFILFEGDLENRSILKGVIGRLDGKKLKVTGIKEPLKILASETKLRFPTKYDWDSFFRDAGHMNEMKPGERPDTIHIQNIPIQWFSVPNGSKGNEPSSASSESLFPSERIFRRVWEGFGEIRTIDIPMLDPYRSKIKTSLRGMKTFNFNVDKVFEAYIQYKEYLGFVKAMDALRGAYLAKKDDGKLLITAIKVDFDKTKHLSEEVIKQRETEIEKLRGKEAIAEKSVYQAKSFDKTSMEKPSSSATSKSDKKSPNNKADNDPLELERKIAMEERKYLVARRKLEAIRLIDFLFERLKSKQILKQEAEAKERKEKANKRAAAAAAREEEAAKEYTEHAIDRRMGRTLEAEETRLRELAMKSLKKAKGVSGNYSNYRPTSGYFPNRPSYSYDYQRTDYYDYGDEQRREEEYRPNTVYGSVEADRAYEKYFRSISGLQK